FASFRPGVYHLPPVHACQIIADSLALLAKTQTGEHQKPCSVPDVELRGAGARAKANEGGIHFRWRTKRRRGHVEYPLYVRKKLRMDAEIAVVARAWAGGKTCCHFLLDQENALA